MLFCRNAKCFGLLLGEHLHAGWMGRSRPTQPAVCSNHHDGSPGRQRRLVPSRPGQWLRQAAGNTASPAVVAGDAQNESSRPRLRYVAAGNSRSAALAVAARCRAQVAMGAVARRCLLIPGRLALLRHFLVVMPDGTAGRRTKNGVMSGQMSSAGPHGRSRQAACRGRSGGENERQRRRRNKESHARTLSISSSARQAERRPRRPDAWPVFHGTARTCRPGADGG